MYWSSLPTSPDEIASLMACTVAIFLSPVELEAELEAELVSALADFCPLLLQAVMKQIKPAEAIIKNFFILMILV
jgi:hypothetical protein